MNDSNGNILLFSNAKNGKVSLRKVKEGDPNFNEYYRGTDEKLQQRSIVKNGANIFRLQCIPRSRSSREGRQVQLVEYDNRMRQEAERYSRLLLELSETRWFARHVAGSGEVSYSKEVELNNHLNCVVDRTIDRDIPSDSEATRLTEDEILYGGDLTMDRVIFEKKKQSVSNIEKRLNRTNTQHSTAFQCALSSQ